VFFQSDLFNSGQRPAIDVGISVSRVGGAAQVKAMKKVSGSLRIDLSQYRELEAFAAFASDLDATSKAQLERGARLYELLKQPQYSPIPVEEQVAIVYLGTNGYYDSVPVEDVRRFNAEFLAHARRKHADIFADIRDSGDFSDESAKALVDAVEEFKKDFAATDGTSVVTGADAEAMDADKVGQETVKVNKPAPKK
jgi:F-type H+-transporting ATPase subunit alpha